jgi:hypothetical protein
VQPTRVACNLISDCLPRVAVETMTTDVLGTNGRPFPSEGKVIERRWGEAGLLGVLAGRRVFKKTPTFIAYSLARPIVGP